MELRKCKTCGEQHPLTRDYFGSTPSGGFRYKCRNCMLTYVKEYDNANADRKKAASQRARRRSHLSAGRRKVLWRELIARDGSRCFYCQENLPDTWHIDHKTPVAKEGSDNIENLVLACEQCNQEKHNKTVDEYRSWKRKIGLDVNF